MSVSLPPDLERCLRHGDSAGTAALLMAMTQEERRRLLPAYKATLRGADAFDPEPGPLLIAGAAALSTPAQVAAWMGRSPMRFFFGPLEPVIAVLAVRDEAWLRELATRLAETFTFDISGHWHLVSSLIGLTGAPVPTNDAFVRSWVRHRLPGAETPSAATLRSDPFLPTLLPRIFEIDGLGPLLERWNWKERGDTSASSAIAAALVALSDQGTIDRSILLDGAIGRLLRGDAPGALRPFVELHRQLRPSLDELAARQIDYLRLLPDARSFVASMAQAALRTLDEAGRLPFDALAEASDAVLGRPEKTLVREQLSWLGRVVTRDPASAAEVARLLAVACAHPDLALAERARSMVDRFGGTPEPLPAADTATGPMAATAPARVLPPPIGRSAELAAELVALLDGSPPDPAIAWERVLDGLVRRAAAESPAEFALALAPIAARQHPMLGAEPDPMAGPYAHLQYMIVRLAGPPTLPMNPVRLPAGHGLGRVLTARVNEICLQLRRSPVPYLIALPTSFSGHLEPAVLLERLLDLEQRGVQPWPLDLDQALLRLPRDLDPAIVEQARRLTSPAGIRAAEWMARNGMTDPPTQRIVAERQNESWKKPLHPMVALVKVGHPVQPPNAIATAATGWYPFTNRFRWYPERELWPATLPSHREVVAAHLLPAIADAAEFDLTSGPSLTFLADTTGPLGPASALCLAYGLATKAADMRASAVDAVLHLGAAGTIDTAAVGTEIGTLCAAGELKLNRIAAALDEVNRAGGAETTWSLTHAALPLLLGPPSPLRGIPELLQLAARTAAQLGIRSTVDGLDAAASRGGSSRFVVEARRLQRVLATGELT